jgi:hypothetical protein
MPSAAICICPLSVSHRVARARGRREWVLMAWPRHGYQGSYLPKRHSSREISSVAKAATEVLYASSIGRKDRTKQPRPAWFLQSARKAPHRRPDNPTIVTHGKNTDQAHHFNTPPSTQSSSFLFPHRATQSDGKWKNQSQSVPSLILTDRRGVHNFSNANVRFDLSLGILRADLEKSHWAPPPMSMEQSVTWRSQGLRTNRGRERIVYAALSFERNHERNATKRVDQAEAK